MSEQIIDDSPDVLLERFEKIRSDPWEFLKAVRTQDPADEKCPIKAFPVHLDYLRLYARTWQKKPKVLCPKSRRMKLSWINIALYTWDAMFHIGRHIAFVSKKEDDSNELIKKAKFIVENLDPILVPKELIPQIECVYNKLRFPQLESVIQGFPSGADQLRQFTFSGILADEMAFWDNAEEMYSASLPTVEGGGRFTGISTAAPGFFKRLVFDEMDDNLQDKKPVKHFYPAQGIDVWENERNRFTVVQLHYSADPIKTKPYMQHIKESMPIRKWNQEYEIVWDSFEGLPVYQDWVTEVHGAKEEIFPHIGMPLLIGMDFGLTPAAVICQIQEDTLCVLKEFTAFGMGVKRFMSWMVPQLRSLYPHWADTSRDYVMYIDPSGFARSDTDETSCAQVIQEAMGRNVKMVGGAIHWDERRGAVEHFLTRRSKKGACLQVSLPNCPLLVQGFQGGYRYPNLVNEKEPHKIQPIKDKHSHVHDALQMVATKLIMIRNQTVVSVPRPSYSWSNSQDESAILYK